MLEVGKDNSNWRIPLITNDTKMQALISAAVEVGFTHAAPLKTNTLRFLPEVREMCNADRCHHYNTNWMCPPACGALEECAARAAGFKEGIIVQSVGDLEDSFDIEAMQRIEQEHKKRFQHLAAVLSAACSRILALGAGSCNLCEFCTYPDAPCRFPDKAISSMEANGLWVSDVCEKNGVPYNYGPNMMAFTSCILVSE
jgi:predicted metal-binding protein